MKIKNLFTSGKMNKDVDERLLPKGEFIDATNIRVLNTSGSDGGAVENEKGNVLVTNIPVTNSPMTIGSIADQSDEKIYWFVVNSLGHSYIYEYDTINKITTTILGDTRSGVAQVLNFDKNYKITGVNIFYNIPRGEKLLVFTDNLNNPRCININRAKTYGTNEFEEDDINLYKKPPYEAPTITPTNTLKASENSVKERFFAFAYRYKYLDGEFSALSSFSNYQFVPASFNLDFNTVENKGMLNVFNSYRIKYNTGDKRVTDIQIVFKSPNESAIFIAENINKKDSSLTDNASKTYVFSNKKIYKALPKDELYRVFDNVPLKALSQDIVSDRLVFGNYTTQYNIKENENDESEISVRYNTVLKSDNQEGSELEYELSSDRTKVVLDITGIDLKKGSTLILGIDLESIEIGSEPDNYYGGNFNGSNGVVLSQNYGTVQDFVESDDFDNALSALSSNFAAGVETESPEDTVESVYGSFSLFENTTTSITILAPIITHVTDNTPGDNSITDGDTTDFVEQFLFRSNDTQFYFSDKVSNASLKSLKNYEVGISYLDKYGRYSSIIPAVYEEGKSNEVFVPVENSPNINTLKVSVNSKPPYWADRYKFFVKDSRQHHYNIFATLFYEEGVYRWVKLEGANLGKVEQGDYLVVKSDDDGPMIREVKVKVLEITTKNAVDETTDSNGDPEGWIKDNEDAEGSNIIEQAGTYMKIKPNGFKMDWNPYNFQSYKGSNGWRGGPFGESGYPNQWLPYESDLGLAQNYIGGNWVSLDINSGSRIAFDFYSFEKQDSNNNDVRFFKKDYVVGGSYVTDETSSAFEKWLSNETEWTKPAGENYYQDLGGQMQLTFINTDGRIRVNVRSTEFIRKWEAGRITAEISMQLVNGIIIFETTAEENDTDIFYETQDTFKIENGLHLGNIQNQTNDIEPLEAVSELSFFNCFSFGNGTESISIMEDRFSFRLSTDYRPNIALTDGYKELVTTHGLIHSGSYNENSGFNAMNEFNSSRGITKFLDTKFGSIQKIFSRESDIIVFQEDRVSKIMYGKTILSSPDGTGSLSQVEKVLGQDVPYSGEYGISLNPESFASYEGRMYFTDANRGAVLRLGNEGITPISYSGMKAYFKDNLYNNRGSFNIGGFDPRYHQYVISLGSQNKSTKLSRSSCSSQFTKNLSGSFTYEYELGNRQGDASISYDTSSTISINIVYNGVTYTNSSLTGSGSVSFPVTSASNIAEVTITGNSSININHICPTEKVMDVVLIVVNDSLEASENIINRYKHSGANVYNSDLDVFEFDGVTRFETISGPLGIDSIPDEGDTVTMSSLRQLGSHSGDFNDCNSMGYLISDAQGLSVQNIIDQATYPTISSTENTEEEDNTASFVFNRENSTETLYLVWNYIDNLPVLVDDSVTGIVNGGSSIINVVQNDTVPSVYTLSIGTQPSNGTVVVNSDNTITYSHNAGESISDSFTYIISRGGTCQAEATVTTEAIEISEDTYIYIYFDASGSMNNTLSELQTLRTSSLKSTLQDLYATAGTESSGNTDPTTNGSNEYDSHVSIVYSGEEPNLWSNERTMAALSDSDVNAFIGEQQGNHTPFPADATNVIMLVFQDEASPVYHSSSSSFDGSRTTIWNSDISTFRSRVAALNTNNGSFYRSILFQVDGSAGFKSLIQAADQGTGNYAGISGFSDLSSGANPTITVEYDVEDSTNDNLTAPFKPGSSVDRFDQWQYYYLYKVTDGLNTLGFTPNNVTWPVIIDD